MPRPGQHRANKWKTGQETVRMSSHAMGKQKLRVPGKIHAKLWLLLGIMADHRVKLVKIQVCEDGAGDCATPSLCRSPHLPMMMRAAACPTYRKYNHDLLSLRTHMLGILPLAQPVEIPYHPPKCRHML